MVWPTRMRRPQRKHAFEEALEDARLGPDDDLDEFLSDAFGRPASAPAVGSLGDIAVAAGYVAQVSLQRAYDDVGAVDAEPPEKPLEAARKLKTLIAERVHSPQELKRLRRRFAAQNHPDRVAPELAAEALEAMAEVNAAIDAALKRR